MSGGQSRRDWLQQEEEALWNWREKVGELFFFLIIFSLIVARASWLFQEVEGCGMCLLLAGRAPREAGCVPGSGAQALRMWRGAMAAGMATLLQHHWEHLNLLIPLCAPVLG